MAQFTKRYVNASHLEFVHSIVTPFILQQHQYCDICVQESTLSPNESISTFSLKLKKEVRINTLKSEGNFKVLWTKYVSCI